MDDKSQSRGVCPRTPITFFVRPKKVIQETPPRFTAHFVGPLRCWLRHNLKVSLRRNKLLRSVLSTGQAAAELATLKHNQRLGWCSLPA